MSSCDPLLEPPNKPSRSKGGSQAWSLQLGLVTRPVTLQQAGTLGEVPCVSVIPVLMGTRIGFPTFEHDDLEKIRCILGAGGTGYWW